MLDRFELLPNATGAREISSPRAGYVSAIDAEGYRPGSAMIGAGRDTKEDAIDPAVGVILEVKVGQKVDAGGVLCRLYYTREENVEEAAQLVEDAFRISSTAPEEPRTDSRSRRLTGAVRMERFTGLLGLVAIMAVAYLFSSDRRAIQPRVIFWGLGLQFGFAFLVLKTRSASGSSC